MNNKVSREWLVWGMLVMSGVGVRILFRDWPNFAPVAAMSLFAGYAFTSRLRALIVAPAIMLLSDCAIGFYKPLHMLVVYVMLTWPMLAGLFLKDVLRLDAPTLSAAVKSFAGLVASSLLASVLFFLVTNFMCWYGWQSYELSWTGLMKCYAAALPFFRNTLCGDLTYSCLLFGSYAAIAQWNAMGFTVKKPVPATIALR